MTAYITRLNEIKIQFNENWIIIMWGEKLRKKKQQMYWNWEPHDFQSSIFYYFKSLKLTPTIIWIKIDSIGILYPLSFQRDIQTFKRQKLILY